MSVESVLSTLLSKLPVLDVDTALEHTGGDRELLGQLCGVFLSEGPLELEGVQAAVEAGAAEEIERAAHKLKGSTSALGGVRASEAALQMERAAAGSTEDIGSCFAALSAAVTELLQRARQLGNEIASEPS